MLLATPEQRTVRLGFPRAGPFGPLGRPKDMIERLEQNKCEQSRLMTAVEYNSKHKRVHSKFLLSHNFIETNILLQMVATGHYATINISRI